MEKQGKAFHPKATEDMMWQPSSLGDGKPGGRGFIQMQDRDRGSILGTKVKSGKGKRSRNPSRPRYTGVPGGSARTRPALP